MYIKICANTNLADAALAANLGADAVGFVFATSTRQVTVQQVAAITPHLPAHVERVGVFDSRDAEEIATTVRDAGLTGAQLHGGFDPELTQRLRAMLGDSVRIIQTLHWTHSPDAGDAVAMAVQVAGQIARVAELGTVDRILIDSKVGGASGGTGVAFDWERAAEVFASAPANVPLIAAGGLRPENVADAILRLHPWGVDVASGVEASPGSKDAARVALFLANARGLPR
jgi:phosphoribosylanthranilate isomerase